MPKAFKLSILKNLKSFKIKDPNDSLNILDEFVLKQKGKNILILQKFSNLRVLETPIESSICQTSIEAFLRFRIESGKPTFLVYLVVDTFHAETRTDFRCKKMSMQKSQTNIFTMKTLSQKRRLKIGHLFSRNHRQEVYLQPRKWAYNIRIVRTRRIKSKNEKSRINYINITCRANSFFRAKHCAWFCVNST